MVSVWVIYRAGCVPPYCSVLLFVVKENNVSASLLSEALYQQNAEIEKVSIPSRVTTAMLNYWLQNYRICQEPRLQCCKKLKRYIMSQESLLLFSKWFYNHRSCRVTPSMLQVVVEAHDESGVPESTPSIISYYPSYFTKSTIWPNQAPSYMVLQ